MARLMNFRLSQTQFAAAIGGAWAGGLDGMDVTERVLNMLPVSPYNQEHRLNHPQALLAPNGRLYLVAIEQNKPGAIIERHSLHGQVREKKSPLFANESRSCSDVEQVERCCL